MQDLRVGVIGVGGRGQLARHAHCPGQGSRLVAGADVSDKALDGFKAFVVGDVFTASDYRILLERKDIDAVFVASPDFLHEEQAVAALEAGKAVYLEKPMAISLEGCDRILRTAMRTGSKLYLGHNMRHFPSVLKMKELIDAGLIGRVQAAWCRHFIDYGGDAYFRDWHSERRFSNGLLLQKAAHDIDVIHWLAGSYTTSVVAMGRLSVYDKCERRGLDDPPGSAAFDHNHWPPLAQQGMSPVIDIEDHNMVLMQLADGTQCSYMQCHYTPDSCRNYTFIGTSGRIENFGDSGVCEICAWTGRGANYRRPDVVHNLKEAHGSHGGSDPRIVAEFLDFVRDGIPTNTSPVAARNAVAVGCMATESLRNDNARRHIPPVDPALVAYFENGQRS